MESAVRRWENMTPAEERELLPPVPTAAQVAPAVLFADTSPPHAMPGNLHIAQMVVLDGISTSIDAISIAYRSLQAGLLEFNRAMGQHRHPSRTLTVPAVMNAWTMIDAAYRLRLLVPHAPRPQARPGGDVAAEVAHAGGVVPSRRPAPRPADPPAPRGPPAGVGQLVVGLRGVGRRPHDPGRPAHTRRPQGPDGAALLSPLGKRVEIPIGLVTLSAAGESVC